MCLFLTLFLHKTLILIESYTFFLSILLEFFTLVLMRVGRDDQKFQIELL